MLTENPKISNLTKGDTFQLIFRQSHEKNGKSALMQISQVFGTL